MFIVQTQSKTITTISSKQSDCLSVEFLSGTEILIWGLILTKNREERSILKMMADFIFRIFARSPVERCRAIE